MIAVFLFICVWVNEVNNRNNGLIISFSNFSDGKDNRIGASVKQKFKIQNFVGKFKTWFIIST